MGIYGTATNQGFSSLGWIYYDVECKEEETKKPDNGGETGGNGKEEKGGEQESAKEEEGSSTMLIVIIAVVLVVFIVVALAVFIIKRRRSPSGSIQVMQQDQTIDSARKEPSSKPQRPDLGELDISPAGKTTPIVQDVDTNQDIVKPNQFMPGKSRVMPNVYGNANANVQDTQKSQMESQIEMIDEP